ncbi:arrestin 3a, retinal (X-arrestin) [Clupea harengus]|uniref:Arrestin-C n=1 Tax=Clupea harengus TaxID=7950 RepID=A0A6P8FWN1_CLUHA|nr:arrestin 3a, retinal (X-arrestin) [Clupea harengus]
MAKVFKKTSGNGQLTLLLGKRDYVDHVDTVDAVEGVLKVDPAGLDGKKAWIQMACAFRYGRDDLDVIGLSFRKDIWFQYIQVYPVADHKPTKTAMHDTLMTKAGDQGIPFTFNIPTNLPCSVTLQPGEEDKGKACGVDFEVKGYVAKEGDDADEVIEKKDTCRLIIRKIQFAPDKAGSGVSEETSKNSISVTASIDKEIYYHGEAIPIKIKAKNDGSKPVKKIKVTIDQTTDVVLYSADKYTKSVVSEEFSDTLDVGGSLEKTVSVTPSLAANKEKKGLALDGRLKDEDTNLASSTILRPGMEKEVLGILVTYKIKVTFVAGGGGLLGGLTATDVTVELPLTLMNPKPTA